MRMCMFVQERLWSQSDQGLLGYYRLMHLPKKQFANGFCVGFGRLLLEVWGFFSVLYWKIMKNLFF